jgi:hypothetical protein
MRFALSVMAAKLGILVIHGMGSQKNPHFADETIHQINGRVEALGHSSRDLAWQPVFWADILEPHEKQLLSKLSTHHNLGYTSLREFVLRNLGDAVAYQREPGTLPDVYQRIHTRVHEAILQLRTALDDRDAPLVILAHSLGCYIMSNYIWDQQHSNIATIPGGSDFEKMRTLCTMVTFGCNIALFSLALQEYVGLAFPAEGLPEQLKRAARWLNYFDPEDILGYPVKPLWEGYASNPQVHDIEINVGSLLTAWNPLSHDGYWTDDDFTAPVAAQIAALLAAI